MKKKKHIFYPLLSILIIVLVVLVIRIIGGLLIKQKVTNGLFDAAKDAVEHQNEIRNTVTEEESAEFRVGNKVYSSVEDYLNQ